MTKITIFSGFLGAGKTTLIKKLIADGYQGEKLVLIENEFGQIGIDGGFLQDAGVEITEMNSGCICCSLVGDFGKALVKVLDEYAPDRILIEPSGVGKLSDVIRAVQNIGTEKCELDGFTTVVDAKKCKMYQKNFGEFFNNQITYASCLILSHTAGLKQEKLDECVKRLRELNPAAPIVTTDWDKLSGKQLTDAMTQKNTLDDELKALLEEAEHHHHEHHHDHNEEEGEADEYGVSTFVYYRRRPMNLGRFDDFVARLWPKNIIRCKGMCYFADEYDMCYLFEQAGRQFNLKQAGEFYATMPKEELMEMMAQDPILRRDWDEQYGDRMQKLVFIGQHMDTQFIEEALDNCLE